MKNRLDLFIRLAVGGCVLLLLAPTGVLAQERLLRSDPLHAVNDQEHKSDSKIIEKKIENASAKTSYDSSIRISGSALKPRTSNVEWVSAGGCIYVLSGNANTILNTPVYLPQGANVKYFRIYYNDQNEIADCSAWFTAYDLFGTVANEWLVQSSGTGQNYSTTDIIDHEINYDNYAYMINWRPNELGSDMQVCGFRVYYKAPESRTKTVVIPLN